MQGFIFLRSFVEVVLQAVAGVTGPWSLASFGLAIILFILLKVRSRKVPTIVWILVGLLVLVPIGLSTYEAIATQTIYRVRVTVVDPQKIPVDDAKVWSSLGGEAKKIAGGWEFAIPVATKPHDGKLTIYALEERRLLNGNKELVLGNDYNPSITIQLTKDNSARVRGNVIDGNNKKIAGATVSVLGYEAEAVKTGPQGNFELAANAAVGEQIVLHVEKQGFVSVDQGHVAGDTTATILLLSEGDKRPLARLERIPTFSSDGLVLPIWVTDKTNLGLPGIRLAPAGNGSVSPPTDNAGRTQIRLAPSTKTGVWVTLQLIRDPRVHPPWFMVSPWDGNCTVPELAGGSNNFIRVVLIRQGEKVAAADSNVISAVAANIIEARKAGSLNENSTVETERANASDEAAKFGYSLATIHQLIESSSKTAADPFERGIAKLYLRDYVGAVRDLTAATKADVGVENRVTANYFLGIALYEDGKYGRAAETFGMAASLRDGDLRLTRGQVASFYKAGMFGKAASVAEERFFFQFRPTDSAVEAGLRRDVADVLAGLKQNRYALSFYQSALDLEIMNQRSEVETLQSIGSLYSRAGHFEDALQFYNAALASNRNIKGRDLNIGIINDLAKASVDLGRYAEAQQSLRNVLKREYGGVSASDRAITLNNLADIYLRQSKFSEAESLLGEALELQTSIDVSSFELAKLKTNLGFAYLRQQRYDKAEVFLREAFSLWETAPPKHFDLFKQTADNYSRLLTETNRFDQANEIQERFNRVLSLAPREQSFIRTFHRARPRR